MMLQSQKRRLVGGRPRSCAAIKNAAISWRQIHTPVASIKNLKSGDHYQIMIKMPGISDRSYISDHFRIAAITVATVECG